MCPEPFVPATGHQQTRNSAHCIRATLGEARAGGRVYLLVLQMRCQQFIMEILE